MATLNIPNSFTNGTTASANEVNANFNAVKSFVETSLVQTDGSVKAGTAAITDGAVTTAKIATATLQLLAPTGSVTQFAGTTAPTGWFLCNGQELAIATYPDLYAVVGTLFGALTNGSGAVGTTHFRVPDLQGRFPVGKGASAWGDVVGETGGSASSVAAHSHTLSGTATSNGAHSHTAGTGTDGAHIHRINLRTGGNTVTHNNTSEASASGGSFAQSDTVVASTSSEHAHSVTVNEGGAHAHDLSGTATSTGDATGNLPPFIVLNYIIKA